jgi:nucleoside-diphosphate-sugar epimerase
MRIFITSATGYVGWGVAARLRERGHSIAALARTARSEERLRAARIQVVRGDLARPEGYGIQAARADVIVHTAFEYAADGSENLDLDLQATRVLARGRRLIYTSNAYRPRFETERMALVEGSTNAVVRLGMVYGGSGGGTVSSLFGAAHRNRQLPYPRAAADNRWSLIHLDDLAELYARLVETTASGVFNAVDGHPLTVQHTLERVGAVCGVAASMQDDAEVSRLHDPHTVEVMNRDIALDCTRAQETGWAPRYRSFVEGAAAAYAEWCTR